MGDTIDIVLRRQQKVAKQNSLIQQSRYSLSLQEQKLVCYLVSKIRRGDSVDTLFTVNMKDICDVMGLDRQSGYNYRTVKKAFERIVTVAVWITTPEREILVRWLDTVVIERGSGMIQYTFSKSIEPFLFDLEQQFTQYILGNVLTFSSKYSVRLYEIARSYARLGSFKMDLAQFKKTMDAEAYDLFADLRRKCIEPALHDVNTKSDLKLEVEYIKHGKAVDELIFYIRNESLAEHVVTNDQRRRTLKREVERRNARNGRKDNKPNGK